MLATLLTLLFLITFSETIAQQKKPATTTGKKLSTGKDFVEIKSKVQVIGAQDSTSKETGIVLKKDSVSISSDAAVGESDAFVPSDDEDADLEAETEAEGKKGTGKNFAVPTKKKSSKYIRYLSEIPKIQRDTAEYTFYVNKSLVREDTTAYDDIFSNNIVIISDEIAIDCVWVTLTEYFAIWDSETVNPYRRDPKMFKDTIEFTLYDTTAGLFWHPPLDTAKVNSEFGFRNYRWHHGIDLDLDKGDPVYAPFDGVIRISKTIRGGYGKFIVMRHLNGLETVFGHLSKQLVETGIYVKAGTKIGLGGSTGRSSGPHLHYETRYEGMTFNPREIYDFATNSLKSDTFVLTPEHFKHLTGKAPYSYAGRTVNVRNATYHVVTSGDSLWKISRMYKTSVAKLCELNGLNPKSVLRLKQKIRIK